MTGRAEAQMSGGLPDRLIMAVPGLPQDAALEAAHAAVMLAQARFPRVSGATAGRFYAVAGDGFFGVAWQDRYVWFQEEGIKAFTMRNLAGKTIPMWVDADPDTMAKAGTKAKTRTTQDGRRQVLIFRRAANPGERKVVNKKRGGAMVPTSVPRSYPGAPGRISKRETKSHGIRRAGRVAHTNVGVRWRHPGLSPARYIRKSIQEAAMQHGIPIMPVNPEQG